MEINLNLIFSGITLLTVLFGVYKYFRDPDVMTDKTLAIMKERCDLKHKNIDENIFTIKENHLRHLEEDVKKMSLDIQKILTILEERDKNKS